MSPQNSSDFIPALRVPLLTPFYDRVVAWSIRDSHLKSRLADLIAPEALDRILDLGCGTGTLLRELRGRFPDIDLTGVDADPSILALATHKLGLLAGRVRLEQAFVQSLPFGDASFDRVVSSMMFHHLLPDAKRAALLEGLRVLVPGGQLLLADFGRARDAWRRASFVAVRALDGFRPTRLHAQGRFGQLLQEAGFVDVRAVDQLPVPLGHIDVWVGRRPGGSARKLALVTS
jgi:SAM-dependent methyltransferase